MARSELKASLENFVKFTRTLKGDEKSEAQIFLDHLFRALGHEGVQEAGATLEFRIAKKPGSAKLEVVKGDAAKGKGGKKFADLGLLHDQIVTTLLAESEKTPSSSYDLIGGLFRQMACSERARSWKSGSKLSWKSGSGFKN